MEYRVLNVLIPLIAQSCPFYFWQKVTFYLNLEIFVVKFPRASFYVPPPPLTTLYIINEPLKWAPYCKINSSFLPVDTFKVYYTRWNIQTVIDNVSVSHSISIHLQIKQMLYLKSQNHKKYIFYQFKHHNYFILWCC